MASPGKKYPKKEHHCTCGCEETGSKAASGGLDLEAIRLLTELMKEQGLAEVEMAQGDDYIHVRRAGVDTAAGVPMMAAPVAPPPAIEENAPTRPTKTIDSPMVGTFYISSSPEAKPFIAVGDTVGPETTVCIIEAMKVFNQIPAETSGRIVRFLVENGATVEFGQPLFAVE
ncbi:MAG: acetyl-CoA carboxylase biotin carboxyl carrier protein [Thermoguttaceae bacterium]|nr:acetyl-CoA carboxylase biotin carboxyl carrier protein [Thermoguttaceae bacterium]